MLSGNEPLIFILLILKLLTLQPVICITPTFTVCPSDQRVSVTLGATSAHVTWDIPETTNDDDILIFKSHEEGTFLPVGINIVTYTFSDMFNSVASCTFTVNVEAADNKPPEVTGCPDDFTVPFEAGVDQTTATWTEPTANDDSGEAVLITRSHIPGGIFQLWTLRQIVQYTFSDSSNNLAYCSFTVIFTPQDTTPPYVSGCDSLTEAQSNFEEDGAIVFWQEPHVEDSGGPYSVTQLSTVGNGDFFPVGTTLVQYRYTDTVGLSSYCNTTVRVRRVDSTPPRIENCPSMIRRGISRDEYDASLSSSRSLAVSWTEITAYDESGTSLTQQSHTPGDLFPIDQQVNVEYRFEDAFGNQARCVFPVSIVVDSTPPNIIGCSGDITRTISPDPGHVNLSWVPPQALDDVSVEVTQFASHPWHYGLFYPGSTEVYYAFSDDAGNTASCTFFVDVSTYQTMQPGTANCSIAVDDILVIVAIVAFVMVIISLSIVLAITCYKLKQIRHYSQLQSKTGEKAPSNRYVQGVNGSQNEGFSEIDESKRASKLGPIPPVPDQAYMELTHTNVQNQEYYITPDT